MRYALAAVLLAVFVLFGCAKDDTQTRPGRPTPSESGLTPGGVTTSATPSPTDTPTPSPSPTPTPMRSRDDYRLADLYPEIRQDVYLLPLGEYLKNGYVADIDINNDFVCVEFFASGSENPDGTGEDIQRFILFHLGVPDIISVREIRDGTFGNIHLLEDGTVIVPLVNGEILELDMDLQEIRRFPVSGGSLLGVTEDHDLWFRITDEEAEVSLVKYTLDGKKQLEVSCGNINIHGYLRTEGENVVFSAFRTDYSEYQVRLDTGTGKLTAVDGLHIERECHAELLEYSTDSKWIFGGIDQSGPIYTFDRHSSMEIMEDMKYGRGATSQWHFSDDDSENSFVTYRVYDIQRRLLLGELESDALSEYGFYGRSHLTERGYVVLDVTGKNNCEELILWDTTGTIPVEIPGSREITATEETLALRKKAERIREKYGVRMYFEEVDMSGGMFNSYALIPCEDYDRLNYLMDSFEESISEYPRGFWTDILADGNKRCVRFFLCDGFQRTDLSGIERAAALTSTAYEDICMAYGSKYMNQFRETFVHETMHMMEIRIREYCRSNGLDFENYWLEDLNSPKYGYHDAYTDESGQDLNDDRGTYGRDPKNAWFIDAYSRTTVREDRARILENLFLGNEYYFKKSEHLKAKAQNLCAIIRAAFPSVGSCEYAMRWENYIGVLDPEEYIERYRAKADGRYKDDIDQSESED